MAAKKLGFTQSWIRKMCAEGKIKASKQGHDWLFSEQALKNIKRQRKAKAKVA
jgi:excisionase family DNA binding protein